MDSKPLSIATASIPEQPLVLHLVTSVIKKTVIPEVFYRESMLSNRFPIKDFGNDELLLLPYLQVTALVVFQSYIT
jgi:hypothetical protein